MAEERVAGWDLKYDLLGAVETEGFRGEVRMFPGAPACELMVHAPADILSLNLLPEGVAQAPLLAHPDRFSPLGPLAYWPRSTVTRIRSSGRPALNVVSILQGTVPIPRAERVPRSIYDHGLVEIMRLLHDEIRSPGFASIAMIESIAQIVRIKLARLTRDRCEPAPASESATTLSRSELALIRDYIEAQRGSSPSVNDLARLCRMSRRSLLRRFRTAAGTSVTEYIKQVQLAKAKSLLVAGNTSLKQVAYEVGFMTPSNFSLAFKRSTGMTPSEFRAMARGG